MNKKKKILLIDLHPDSQSFCSVMAQKYVDGAIASEFEVKIIKVRELNFDNVLHFGYREIQALEPDLIQAQEEIKWCSHLVFITPVWWGSSPSNAKGFIDRVLLSGFSYKFDIKKKMPVGLLKNRSASVIYTQGAPFIYSKFFTGDAFWNFMKICILQFCGFSNIKRKCFDKVKSGTDKERLKILNETYELGKKGF